MFILFATCSPQQLDGFHRKGRKGGEAPAEARAQQDPPAAAEAGDHG